MSGMTERGVAKLYGYNPVFRMSDKSSKDEANALEYLAFLRTG